MTLYTEDLKRLCPSETLKVDKKAVRKDNTLASSHLLTSFTRDTAETACPALRPLPSFPVMLSASSLAPRSKSRIAQEFVYVLVSPLPVASSPISQVDQG